jgi:hypothetical protein
VLDGAGGIGGRRLRVGRRPYAQAVLGAREVIDPYAWAVDGVALAVRVGVDGARRRQRWYSAELLV